MALRPTPTFDLSDHSRRCATDFVTKSESNFALKKNFFFFTCSRNSAVHRGGQSDGSVIILIWVREKPLASAKTTRFLAARDAGDSGPSLSKLRGDVGSDASDQSVNESLPFPFTSTDNGSGPRTTKHERSICWSMILILGRQLAMINASFAPKSLPWSLQQSSFSKSSEWNTSKRIIDI